MFLKLSIQYCFRKIDLYLVEKNKIIFYEGKLKAFHSKQKYNKKCWKTEITIIRDVYKNRLCIHNRHEKKNTPSSTRKEQLRYREKDLWTDIRWQERIDGNGSSILSSVSSSMIARIRSEERGHRMHRVSSYTSAPRLSPHSRNENDTRHVVGEPRRRRDWNCTLSVSLCVNFHPPPSRGPFRHLPLAGDCEKGKVSSSIEVNYGSSRRMIFCNSPEILDFYLSVTFQLYRKNQRKKILLRIIVITTTMSIIIIWIYK